ncbi:Sodium-dependent phosphate transport protein 2A [Hondaea fermentalgiana]|uniref:Sodium-dependent phosphate transport protein 2A n=1 Tax=Hondaea fermentalgiana TaxID=2315210 RepID=A0A2R5G7Q1_9STRA|nr:Sodium-dependent phosphate transport protein 2A [Hondaea fermentalgiana]|eukprot:GBG25828.1 Sodium-dependent phosphate transport protein 2A [Hondaea fermentalgiana]
MVTAKGVAKGFVLFAGVLFFLYWFLVGLSLLGDAFKVIAGDSAGSLFGAVENPIAGLMVGILATVLVQSSSTTTSIIVAAAGSGVLEVPVGIPMIFGANIGTSVTNTIVSLGFVGDREQYRRGFAGATVHDMFNYMNVCFWLPVEAISSAINGGNGGVLFLITEAMAKSFEACDKATSSSGCEDWEGPLKKITEKISKKIISVDKDVISDFAFGKPASDLCSEILCVDASTSGSCDNHSFKQKRCATSELAASGWCGDSKSKAQAKFTYCDYNATSGLVSVNASVLAAAQDHFDAYKLNKGGIFYDAGLQAAGGWIALAMALVMLMVSLLAMVKILGIAVRGAAEEVLQKALNMNGYLAIIVGAGVTMFVQSSSITTSALTPLVAMGTLSVEGMLPLTLGANIGTTLTGVLASLVSDSAHGFQLAMCHVLFNLFGTLMFYPIPRMRRLPIGAALRLGDLAALYKVFPILYIIVLFLVYPGFFLGVSVGMEMGGAGIAGGVVGIVVFVLLHIVIFWWYWRRAGREWLVRNFGHDFNKDGTDTEKRDGGNGEENMSFSPAKDAIADLEAPEAVVSSAPIAAVAPASSSSFTAVDDAKVTLV